jgi:hypothetical protein
MCCTSQTGRLPVAGRRCGNQLALAEVQLALHFVVMRWGVEDMNGALDLARRQQAGLSELNGPLGDGPAPSRKDGTAVGAMKSKWVLATMVWGRRYGCGGGSVAVRC